MKTTLGNVVRTGIVVFAAMFGVAAAGGGDEEKSPTPTPHPAGEKTLSDVAKDKELKGKEDGKAIVITNESISDYSEKGSLTTVNGTTVSKSGREPVRPTMKEDGTQITVVDAFDPALKEDERRQYWRSKYEQELNRIEAYRRLLDNLDSEIPGLWRDFYSRDDPAYRDGVIKPQLDAALKKREQIEGQLREAEPKLDKIKEDARKDGGQPGWFRGLEPPPPPGPTPTPDIVID
jgi:hypothetical protein